MFLSRSDDGSSNGAIKEVKELINGIAEHLLCSTITLGILEVLKEKKKSFCDLLPVVTNKSQAIETALEKCLDELNGFHHAIRISSYFIQFVEFQKFPKSFADLSELNSTVKKNHSEMSMSDIFGSDYPLHRYFGLSEENFSWIFKLEEKKMIGSRLLSNLMQKTAKGLMRKEMKCLKHSQIIELVVIQSLTLLDGYVQAAVSGQMSTTDVVHCFSSVENNLLDELSLINAFYDMKYSLTNIESCTGKILCVFQLKHCVELSKKIQTVADKLKLSGDFSTIAEIEKKTNPDAVYSLSDIQEELVDSAQKILEITPNMKKVFTAVENNLNILLWLKQQLKGPKEVKVFVEMLSIAAGENEYEIGRVKCFESSCVAFSPLIFGLNYDAGFEELYNACKAAADCLEQNPKIIDDLRDTNRSMRWFEKAKDSHGSVTTKSLEQAKKINSTGCYTVGNINEGDWFLKEEVNVKDVVSLLVRNEDGEEENQCKAYDLDAIYDLQSRLMLLGSDSAVISSDNKQFEKDYFVKISELITRLATVFVSLCEEGNICYLTYKKEIQCNISKARSDNEHFNDLEAEIKKLEQELEEWRLKIVEYRKEYPLLNYFTVKQCLYLQKQLEILRGDVREVDRLEPQVFALLKVVFLKVSKSDVKDAFQMSLVEVNDDMKNNWKKVKYEKPSNFSQLSYKQLCQFVETLKNEHGIAENVALASLVRVYPFDISKAVIWCKKRNPTDDLMDELAEEANKELEIIMEESESNGDMEIDKDNEMHEFLTLEQFAIFLKILLARKGNKFPDERNERDIPDYLRVDKPNLIVLPKDELLYGVLELYLSQNGSLPNSEEILFCSENVSLEMIKLLFLRAVFNDYGIYCLVFADLLSYDISEKLFLFLQNLLQNGMKRPLVIFCCRENENRSVLVSAFDQYRVLMPVFQKTEIITVLKQQLSMDAFIKTGQGVKYAAVIDEERCNTRVISSMKSGMGKSLFVVKKSDELETLLIPSTKRKRISTVTVPLHGVSVNVDAVVKSLLKYEECLNDDFPRIYHFDVAPTVVHGLENFLFNLVVLKCCQTQNGKVWRRKDNDYCVIERTKHKNEKLKESCKGVMFEVLPTTECISPEQTYHMLTGFQRELGVATYFYDVSQFESRPMQRVYQYLKVFEMAADNINNFRYDPNVKDTDHGNCLRILIKYCGITKPSWMELQNFVHFFNQQLLDSEQSVFTNDLMKEELRGFKGFVVKFLLEMAKDFATRSIYPNADDNMSPENDLLIELKRHWEHSFHPYLFFNQDHTTLTFLGFNVNPNGDLIDSKRNVVIQQSIMSCDLHQDLTRQMQKDFVNLTTNYQALNRQQKLEMLCRVMGVMNVHDPDNTYELTVDNMKKMLAIHMRLRCGIPVILMGETGCGKTRLIRFMCQLKAGGTGARNMLLIKIHGGVTASDIERRIFQAKELANENAAKYNISTVLFLDEANTTDAIGLIKGIMIDKRVNGEPLALLTARLEVIAACNPYRRHTDCMIKKLELAGLGYHVAAEKTYEKIGHIPLRQLVYRVHPLPESLKPLVWDFGQLDYATEEAYTRQIIVRYTRNKELPNNSEFLKLLCNVLAASQSFMRQQQDECSFVSLRDVERAVQVTSWFYKKMRILFASVVEIYGNNEGDDAAYAYVRSIEMQRCSLVLALGVCYIARLENRELYMDFIVTYFTGNFNLRNGVQQIKDEIRRCQSVFVNTLELEDNIAKNQALCENIFMMVICIELRIPLFVVGKPGSSKSLAKTIVQDNMQGDKSKSKLFKNFKEIFLSSYQCSPLSTASGIINTFKQCSRFQDGKNLDQFTSVVVLDEVGLAEDSPRMPLKALHPLLEDGTDGSEELTADGSLLKDKRVAFVGISNWALDPAKMNRGIMLCRGQPDLNELVNTARDICSCNERICGQISVLLEPLAKGYLDVYKEQKGCEKLKKSKKEEFFGLRDFYSLIKMVFCFSRQCQGIPSLNAMEKAVRRNFSGLKELDTWRIFKARLQGLVETVVMSQSVSTLDLLQESFNDSCPCFKGRADKGKKHCVNNRYLLIMTEEYTALPIIEEMFLKDCDGVDIIFGSSFPKDQEFSQVCRDVHRIKMCMETGRTVVLMNMGNLYESLYDALNQYYVYLGGLSYVDLGLGTHRVKCRVHENFKLIVIADKETVYETFPIPLINRLEKHYVVNATCMDQEDLQVVEELKKWACDFADISHKQFKENDAFVNFNEDTCSSILIHLRQSGYTDPHQILQEGKSLLLDIATPDSIARLTKSSLSANANELWTAYNEMEKHSSLQAFLRSHLMNNEQTSHFIQVTTFSRLLSPDEKERFDIDGIHVQMMSLMQFQTEESFRDALKNFFKTTNGNVLLIIQCTTSGESGDLIACAQYICKEVKAQHWKKSNPVFILFLLQINHKYGRFKSLSGWQSGWSFIHIDELREGSEHRPSMIQFAGMPISGLFELKSDAQVITVLGILKGCIQAAVRELNDTKNMSSDEIKEKIRLVSELLEGTDPIKRELIKSLFATLNHILTNMEQISNPETVGNWVELEAMEQKHLPDYGTFREALVRCVEDKITPILTDILKQIDVNNNLMILKSNTDYMELWVELFGKVFRHVSKIKGKTFKNSGNVLNVNAQFPFSLQVIGILNEVIKDFFDQDQMKENLIQINNAVDVQSFGNDIKNLNSSALQDYIHDLLHLSFSCLTDDIYKILCFELLRAAHCIVNSTMPENDDELQEKSEIDVNLPAIHVALFLLEERFANAIDMFNFKPDIIHHLDVEHEEPSKGIIFDVKALKMILEIQMLNTSQIENRQFLSSWSLQINEVSVLAKKLFHSKKCPQLFDEESRHLLDNCRFLWTRLRILNLYLDNVFLPEEEATAANSKALKSFLEVLLQVKDDMKSLDSWSLLEDFFHGALQTNAMDCDDRGHSYAYDDFEKRCLVFYVEIVTEFCFSRDDDVNVDPAVLKRIVGYVFHSTGGGTKQFSPVQDYALDATPTIRSFIFQQLLQKEELVETIIAECLQENLSLASSDEDKRIICQLFIHCYEDHANAEASILKTPSVMNYTYVHHISNTLKIALRFFDTHYAPYNTTTEFLKNIALLRFALTAVSSLLYSRYFVTDEVDDHRVQIEMKQLFAVLTKLCVEYKDSECHLYLLKQIRRCYGSNELRIILAKAQSELLSLDMSDNEQASNVESDKYLVYGEVYKELRERLTELLMRKIHLDEYQNYKKALEEKGKNCTVLLLILMQIRIVDCKLMSNIEDIPELKENLKSIETICRLSDEGNIQEVLLHFLFVLQSSQAGGLLDFYFLMADNPDTLQGCFLPTMPDDNFSEVMNAGVGKMHSCPKGHPYVITECGRPTQRYPCPECGSSIGGISHRLDQGNAELPNRDTTKTGHCIGEAKTQPDRPITERRLSTASVALQRLLMHLSMILAIGRGREQVIRGLISVNIGTVSTLQFLVDHIHHNLKILSDVFTKNSDDTFVVVHLFLKCLSEMVPQPTQQHYDLRSKASREQYEAHFNNEVINVFLETLAKDFDTARKELLNDTRIGENKRMRRLYELDVVDVNDIMAVNALNCPPFWEYRQAVSLNSFKLVVERSLVTDGESYRLLALFLRKEEVFRSLKDLPSLIQLQEILFGKYNYKLERKKAHKMTIQEALASFNKTQQRNISKLMSQFFYIWKEISPLLKDYSRAKVNPEFHKPSLSFKDSLSYLLCSRNGPGQCTLALMDFLAYQQNDFLEKCFVRTDDNTRQVPIMKVRENDVISYHPEKDLLPLVFAHCHYSVEMGRGSKIEYDLRAIQKRLLKSLFFGKPKVVQLHQEFVYTDDVKQSKKFLTLQKAIPQVAIPYSEQAKMMLELTDSSHVSNTLRAVEIAIGFLVTTKCQPNLLYRKYLTDILQMDVNVFLPSRKMRNEVRLTHITSVWIMLQVEKAKHRHLKNREPFKDVKEHFTADIHQHYLMKLEDYVRHVNRVILLSLLTQYIISELNDKTENHAEFPLCEALSVYEDQKGSREGYGEEIPDFVLLKHVCALWKLIADAVSRETQT